MHKYALAALIVSGPDRNKVNVTWWQYNPAGT